MVERKKIISLAQIIDKLIDEYLIKYKKDWEKIKNFQYFLLITKDF